jgi:hypothetical protein
MSDAITPPPGSGMQRADLLTVLYHDGSSDTFPQVCYSLTAHGLRVLDAAGHETTISRHDVLTTHADAHAQPDRNGAAIMTPATGHLQAVLAEIAAERHRQDGRWGEQNHDSLDPVLRDRPGGCTPQRMAAEYGIPSAGLARAACEQAGQRGPLTWGHIAIEELAEAVEAGTLHGDGPRLREELVQTAAVLVAWIQCLDRRAGTDTTAAAAELYGAEVIWE